jgi:hypothetical protein
MRERKPTRGRFADQRRLCGRRSSRYRPSVKRRPARSRRRSSLRSAWFDQTMPETLVPKTMVPISCSLAPACSRSSPQSICARRIASSGESGGKRRGRIGRRRRVAKARKRSAAATRSRQNGLGSITMASRDPSGGGSGPGVRRRCSASPGGRRIRWRPSSVASAALWPAQRKGSKRRCESVSAGAATRRTRSTSSSDRQNRTASLPRRSGCSRTLQPPAAASAVRRARGAGFRSRPQRIGAVIGITAQELPCPAARVEFRHVAICGRKPHTSELPHAINHIVEILNESGSKVETRGYQPITGSIGNFLTGLCSADPSGSAGGLGSARIAGSPQLLVDKDVAITDARHPPGPGQMGLISARGALGLGIRVDMQYGTRRLFPRDTLRIGVEKADVGNQM